MPTKRTKVTDIRNVKNYLDTHYLEKIPIKQLAVQMDIKQTTLEKQFKSVYNTSIHQYINRLRINQSLEPLADSDKPIKAIALECGFNSTKTFREAFKHIKKITPADYRRERKKSKS